MCGDVNDMYMKFWFKPGKTNTETISRAQTFNWLSQFKSGITSEQPQVNHMKI
jgi:hypothetical protein